MMDMPDNLMLSTAVSYVYAIAIQTWWGGTRVRPPGIRPPAHSRILWLSTIINILIYPFLICSCRLCGEELMASIYLLLFVPGCTKCILISVLFV